MVSCTGCSIVVNGFPIPGTGGAGSTTPFYTKTVIGEGIGAFSGVTNFNLGTLDFYYTTNLNGQCTGFSGRLEAVSMSQSGTGLFSFSAGTYNCTGAANGGCLVSVYQKFTPNPFLSGIAPAYVAHMVTFSSEGLSQLYSIRPGQTATTTPFDFGAPCGYSEWLYTEISFMLAPYSGSIGSVDISTINCLPCQVGL